jgi:RNA polymerase sigma-70 factor (ECF subfamily)
MAKQARADRLIALLGPVHEAAQVTARRLCRSHADGDDLFQETVLRALDQIGTLRDEARFRGWFYAVMVSVHRARHRRRFWRRLLSLDELTFEPARPADTETWEGAERMAQALATLSLAAREAIVLFELEGFTLEELAAIQNDSIPAVKSRLSRARRRLRDFYEKLDVRAPISLGKERRHGNG